LHSADRRFGSYADSLGALSRPAAFDNRLCYRLAEVVSDGAWPCLTFGAGNYFDVVNLCEATAHEYADAVLRDQRKIPTAEDLPLRALIGDPTDLRRRAVLPAITALTVRADQRSGDLRTILHWRDPTKVATGGGLYQVAPVGMFQPSQDAEPNLANDFSLVRSIVRELSEELLGNVESYGSDTRPIDYERWDFYASIVGAQRATTMRIFWLGLGVDALTLVTDMLVVLVFDAPLFDALFSTLVESNEEGQLVSSELGATGSIGIPFTSGSVEHFTEEVPMQPAGAAVLRLAWRHRSALFNNAGLTRHRGSSD
jgi:hypothetical protein